MKSASALDRTARLFLAGFGGCAVVFAVAGAFVPGLPTTVFVLIASYCFSKSSPRFSRWLRDNRWLGPTVRRHMRGGMSAAAKRAALAAMWTSVAASAALLAGVHPGAAVGTVGMGIVGTLSILFGVKTVPDRAVAVSI